MSSDVTANDGPVHFTGNAPSKFHARSRAPPGPMSVIAAVDRVSLLPFAANCSPDDLLTHLINASFCVMPRFNVRFGHVMRPGSLCTKLFSPPSWISSTPTVNSSPDTSMK